MVTTYDYVILGGGSAAFSAAIRANELGKRTALINAGPIGGTCINVGCVPSKLLLTLGDDYSRATKPRFRSIRMENGGTLDFQEAIREKDRTVRSLRKKKYADVLAGLDHVHPYRGKGRFVGPKQVAVGRHRIRGKTFLIATGSSPYVPPFEGIDKVDYLTNVEALSPGDRPDSLLVLGGRALGLEFAQMYAHFGTKVTLLQRSSRILPNEEPIVGEHLAEYLREDGIAIHTDAAVKEVGQRGETKTVTAKVGGRTRRFEADALLLATGRRPNTPFLNLDVVGVKTREDGAVVVDEGMRTSAPGVWAAGDVIGMPMLETTAAKEGYIAAANAFEDAGLKMDYLSVPHAVFTNPAVASVGLTEEEAERRGIRCGCSAIPMDLVPKAVATRDTRGLAKMVIEAKTGRILGVHLLSSLAADMIHEGALAVKFGLTIFDLMDVVHVFPTMSEALKLVAQSFVMDVEKLSCCTI
jgi:mercuric reductase